MTDAGYPGAHRHPSQRPALRSWTFRVVDSFDMPPGMRRVVMNTDDIHEFAYTPGQTIAYNGWSVVLDGAPTAGDTFSVGPTGANSSDNGNAKLLSNLDDARVLNGGTLTLNGAIGGLTTQVGSAARQADYSAQAQQVIHDQAQAARDAVSGVNLDEEATNLIKYQQAYQAAGKVMQIAGTIFDTLLSIGR